MDLTSDYWVGIPGEQGEGHPLAHAHGYIYLLVGALPRHTCDLSGLLMA